MNWLAHILLAESDPSELVINYSELEQDFKLFFPQLQSHIDNWQLKTNNP